MKRRLLLIPALALVAGAIVFILSFRRSPLVLTGMVTTDEVIVSAEIQGRLQQLRVNQGDHVKRGQLLGVISPEEWKADLTYYENGERSAEADLKLQEELMDQQVKQAEANLASAESLVIQAQADLDNARFTFERADILRREGANSAQDFDQARTTYDGAKARVASLRKQVAAAAAAVDIAKAGVGQVAVRRAALAAATAQKEKAGVRFGHTEIRAPTDGIVDARAALQGEVVNPGQAIVTLIDPNDLWVRVDIEESYIDRVRLGDTLTIRLPSGAERQGTVYFRGVDADYATQRDVSRTKRDIKTFEVRLRCKNDDQSLAVGMTAYVILPFSG